MKYIGALAALICVVNNNLGGAIVALAIGLIIDGLIEMDD